MIRMLNRKEKLVYWLITLCGATVLSWTWEDEHHMLAHTSVITRFRKHRGDRG